MAQMFSIKKVLSVQGSFLIDKQKGILKRISYYMMD